jgi:2-C-methyl-D-erythritol 4-phosphate cytidylyltransferase
VHDAARCCIDERDILAMIQQLEDKKIGGILAISATDTIKRIDLGSLSIVETIDRSQIYLAQTPQMFRYSVLKKSLQHSSLDKITDEASAVELLQLPVSIVVAKYPNFKITYQQDLELAKYILTQRNERQVC